MAAPVAFADPDEIAGEIIARTGKNIRLALPLGLGKANSIANALTRAALEDPNIRLQIYTALTLERPSAKSGLARRFMEPAADRLFGKYPPLQYAELLHRGDLPGNISVAEFFFQAGQWFDNDCAQRRYISANYTHALEYILNWRPHVVAQLLAPSGEDRYSLSCNTDITIDLLEARRRKRVDFLFAAETNANLPFMGGPALCDATDIDLLLSRPGKDFELFSAPKRPISLADQAIGIHAAMLVPDGGTLQIGIGSIGDAIANALILRHENNDVFVSMTSENPFSGIPVQPSTGTFSQGLYAVTEMLVDGILQLFVRDIVKRNCDEAAIHAGFFVESSRFYRDLREMPEERRNRIHMMPVSFTNALYGNEASKRRARVKARFINNAMAATCLGAVASDSLQAGRVVSGVGGQFNFVNQAFALDGARSIITLNATRIKNGNATSNIVWSSKDITIPRHYRDIVVTEYGIADLRGKSDEECVQAMIGIADSRFQRRLLVQAQKAGKLGSDFTLPAHWGNNSPHNLHRWLHGYRSRKILQRFPFGTDFTEEEQLLLPALDFLKRQARNPLAIGRVLRASVSPLRPANDERRLLERMRLDTPRNPAEILLSRLVLGSLRLASAEV